MACFIAGVTDWSGSLRNEELADFKGRVLRRLARKFKDDHAFHELLSHYRVGGLFREIVIGALIHCNDIRVRFVLLRSISLWVDHAISWFRIIFTLVCSAETKLTRALSGEFEPLRRREGDAPESTADAAFREDVS